jgi:hypothetical protein
MRVLEKLAHARRPEGFRQSGAAVDRLDAESKVRPVRSHGAVREKRHDHEPLLRVEAPDEQEGGAPSGCVARQGVSAEGGVEPVERGGVESHSGDCTRAPRTMVRLRKDPIGRKTTEGSRQWTRLVQATGKGQKYFARIFDRTIATVSAWGTGAQRPSLEEAFEIERRFGLDAQLWTLPPAFGEGRDDSSQT